MKVLNFLNDKNFGEIYKKGLSSVKLSRDKSAWGLELGDSGLKAVKARFHDGALFIEAIDRVDYSSINHEITSKRSELIENALNIFRGRNLVNKSDKIIISLSGKMILSRFFSLPPIKKSRIAEAIGYELRKQVPFEPDEIVWDYQQFEDDEATDSGIKIGLFATKKENIYGLLPGLAPIKMNVEAIQITPIAIYNLVHLYSDSDDDVIVINVEKGNTDFIVVGRSKYWNRSIPISEVNTALVREIQRSIGYYVSVSKGTKPEIIYLMGEVFEDDSKIKFIDENLEGKVNFLDLLDKIKISKDFDHPAFNKRNIYGFEAALGLALQGLNLGEIKINLLPPDYIKEKQVSKRKIFACVITIAIFLSLLTQSIKDYRIWKSLSSGVDAVNETFNEVKKFERIYKGIERKVKEEEKNLHIWESIGVQGSFWIEAIHKVIDIIPENVYLLSIESLWDIPRVGKEERSGSKGFFERKKVKTSKEIDTSKEVLIMNIKGESSAPEVSYIEEKVRKPLENLTLFDEQVPVFSDVRLVEGSVHHVKSLENVSGDLNDDLNVKPISFEIQCIVRPLN